jgi:hypothetical protein
VLKFAAIAMATALGATAQPPPPTDEDVLVDRVGQLTAGKVDVEIAWVQCGAVNGAYFPAIHAVVMCEEDRAQPGVALFIEAHELGHAIVDQLDLPVDAGPVANEAAADELAALILLDMGRQDAVIDAVVWFENMADADGSAADQTDPHPAPAERAYRLICLADHDDQTVPDCRIMYPQVLAKWAAAIDAALNPDG